MRIEARPYSRRMRVGLTNARDTYTERHGWLLRADNGSGSPAFAEIAPLPGFGTETAAQAGQQLREIGRQVDHAAIAAIPAARLPCTRSALEACAWQLEGAPARSPVNPNPVEIAALLPDLREATSAIGPLLAQGYTTVKVKIGVEPFDAESAAVERLLTQLNGRARLRLDANGALSVDVARAWLKCLSAHPTVEFLEEPMPTGDPAYADLCALAADLCVTLAADESAPDLAAMQRLRETAPNTVIVVKPLLLGDLRAFMQWRQRDPEGSVAYSSALETVAGLWLGLQLAAREPGRGLAAGFGTQAQFPPGPLTGPPLPAACPADFLTREHLLAAWQALEQG